MFSLCKIEFVNKCHDEYNITVFQFQYVLHQVTSIIYVYMYSCMFTLHGYELFLYYYMLVSKPYLCMYKFYVWYCFFNMILSAG